MKLSNLIAGQLLPPSCGQYLPNVNPATGKEESLLPDSTQEDVQKACQAATEAFPSWKGLGIHQRAQHLRRLGELIEDNVQELALAESRDQGKTLSFARNIDIPRCQKNFDFFCDQGPKFVGDRFGGHWVEYFPLGPVGIIAPWNFPLYLLTWKMAPALIMGNTVVAKPSELTPMTAFLFSELCLKAQVPPGVINIVHGQGDKAGQAIVEHPSIKAISFTGSTATGQKIAQVAARDLKKVSLEMGGKNPCIIFADCDLEKTLETTFRSTFSNQGEVCTCTSRLYIERPLYETFKARLVDLAQNTKVGDPLAPETQMGAMVSQAHLDKVLSYGALAKEEGGRILCGGEQLKLSGKNAGGFFFPPTLIESLPVHCRTNQEEIFGPMATLAPFDTEEEAVNLANATDYGLATSIHTSDPSRACRVAEKLDVGMVWINDWMKRDLRTPFGGVKNSGLGREGGAWGLAFFSQPKSLYAPPSELAPPPPLGAYPYVRRAGNLLFLSGVGPRQGSSQKIPPGIGPQCHSVFQNVRLILEQNGSHWDRLIDVTVFLTDMKRDFPIYNRLYGQYFPSHGPCRTTVEVGSLPSAISIELKCIAEVL